MTATPLTPALLRQQLHLVLSKGREGSVVGFRTDSPWRGKDRLEVDGTEIRVAWCPSALAAREQLLGNEDDGVLAILTDQSERDLGTDVLARLVSGKLYRVDRWRLLEAAFGADRLDPRLVEEAWLAEELLALAPPEGFRPVATGFLDLDTAWATFLARRFRFPNGRAELDSVLAWSASPNRVAELAATRDEIREGVIRRIVMSAGTAGRAIGGLIEAGRGGDALPLGMAMAVIFHPGVEGKALRREAAIRLEGLLGGVSVDPASGQRWAEASERLVASLQGEPDVDVPKLLSRAEAVLAELKAGDLAHLSDVLPAGLKQRMDGFGRQLRWALESGVSAEAVSGATAACLRLVQHRGLPEGSREAAERALKLLRALDPEAGKPAASFLEAARSYAEDASYMDWLREELHGVEPDPALSLVYQDVLTAAEQHRHALDERFGNYLAGWFAAGSSSPELVPVEEFLVEILAPAATAAPVLLVVIDGLSLPIYHRLESDASSRGWARIAPDDAPPRRSGLALLPSVTNVCRASLLTGERTTGGQGLEKKGFESHPMLRARSKGGSPPVLFHKAEIRSDSGGAVASDLGEAIHDPNQRIVGVVVNAVDDYLLNSDQLRTDWGLESIKPLAALLEAATTSERIVVVTSDHGHVPERGLTKLDKGDGGERYRRADGKVERGEVLVEGPRVLAPENRVVVPWSERIRYGKRKTGYHGGASPQEMLMPIAILTTGVVPDGWREVAPHLPDWWEETPVGEPSAEEREEVLLSAPTLRQDEGQGFLFAREKTATLAKPQPWIDELLSSEVYQEQRKLGGRTAPPEATVRGFLEALQERGGVATRMALSQALELPQQRVDALAASIERLLNVEGYPTLEFDRTSGQVRLNRVLLREQFQLP